MAGATIVVILILVAVAILLGRGWVQSGLSLDQRAVTEANLRRISDALAQYASLNRRLPCPAPGNLDSGDASPDSATTACTAADGTVPWRSLALEREVALDGWGNKISYRVFSGVGGFTQANGVSMTLCNSSLGPPLDSALDANSLCKAADATTVVPPNTPKQFTDARGGMLVVQELGAARNANAFVLISHGETGRGAWGAEGGTRATMPNAAGREFTNAQAGGTYWIEAQSDRTVSADASAHFDDILVYRPFADFVKEVKLAERAWGNPFGSTTFTAQAIAAAGGDATQFNTGQATLDFGSFRVTALGDTARNVGFNRDAGGGIGSIGTGSNSESTATMNRATNEGLRFQFDQVGRYLGVTLARFGDQSGELERVSFDFVIGGSNVRVTKRACRSGDGRVNYTINPGGNFGEVTIEARLTENFNYNSTLVVAAIATCPSTNSACSAPGAIPSEDCP
jgi:type II secretory pathway pseudopilin PulG